MTPQRGRVYLCAAAVTWVLAAALGAAVPSSSPVAGALQSPPRAAAAVTPPPRSDLDAFMARVLERRDEAWRTLHDYILSERESFQVLGPADVPLYGVKREYSWYVREGFLVRSPVRFDGVEIPDRERREYEENWLKQEKERERRAQERAARGEAGGVPASREPDDAAPAEAGLQEFVGPRGEPRFISEAYFLRFKFEPGNYYLAGRETLGGREVLRIEYYPTGLFGGERGEERRAEGGKAEAKPGRRDRRAERDVEDEVDRKMNKASLVTLWVDPAEHQIVKYTFDNMDFGFLPGRWLVRVDEATASMTMARVFEGVWLPSTITMRAALTLATGGYRFDYGREFTDYRKAEVGARIRGYVPKGPRP